MKRLLTRASLFFLTAFLLSAQTHVAIGQNPFSIAGKTTLSPDGQTMFVLSFTVPANHYLYADLITVKTTNNTALKPSDAPAPYRKHDQFSDTDRDVYTNSFTMSFPVPGNLQQPVELTIGYQGCSDQICLFPVSTNLTLSGQTGQASKPATVNQPPKRADKDWKTLTAGFHVSGKKEGYIRPEEFTKFLSSSAKGGEPEGDRITEMFRKQGAWTWIALLIIVVGGLGLNLTPCVLPMIPINIAIIGAGTRAGSRARGFALGGIYGGAIALTYGLLGLFVVLTGSRFGTLNASYLFNAVIAVVFLILSLGMFDVLTIDFSRFQQNISPDQPQKGSLLGSFVMGTVSALLAGACVAPVVVSVLLLSADLFKHGEKAGLFLPFLLGIGMGLPWPFLGAGLSFLPKPGQWMERVKHLFGILIIGFAIYYGHLAYRLFMDQKPENKSRVEQAQNESIRNGWLVSLPDALLQAEKERKPVFIDFWASWCKNCLAMEETTFKDAVVRKQLEEFVRVKFRAEHPDDPATTHAMEFFNCLGLPTYVVLVPDKKRNPMDGQ